MTLSENALGPGHGCTELVGGQSHLKMEEGEEKKKHPGEVIGLSNDQGMKLWLSEDLEATDKAKPAPALRRFWVQRSR